MTRTGRRPGPSTTRGRILAAARSRFAREGYEGATIRAVARSARVDPKLVQHFFGSKHDLFIAAMELPFDPTALVGPIVAAGPDGLGERVVGTFVAMWDSPEGRPLVGLLRSVVSSEEASAMMREFFAHDILGTLVASLRLPRPERRASLVASQLFGLALVRYVVRLEPLASASPGDVARWVGPNVDRYLTARDLSGR
ncbi:MAG: TetR family transcriptional regulator [Chloroflexota bacterium]|nr:TetR family transcriptional regulator [Chloroflexota bacterium]MDE3193059.1 TetR family transcriptional regulator [Chloroflexota bacterium]